MMSSAPPGQRIHRARSQTGRRGVPVLLATGIALAVLAGSSLVRSGASAITISLGGTATASISGSMSVTGGAHQLLGASASSITFQNGAAFSTGTGFTGNAFGASGTANTVVFTSGSSY